MGVVYVKAPFVGTAYCLYPGVAFYADDYNPICIGSIGPETGNVVEVNTQHLDTTGQYFRRIGTNYARWNMQDVFLDDAANPKAVYLRLRRCDGSITRGRTI